jgi:hypothetical protein
MEEQYYDYNPDNWIIIELIMNQKIIHKVLAGWSGGYLSGDSWKLNSGITRITEDDNYWYIGGYSGSVYKCHKESETIRMNISGTLEHFRKLVKQESHTLNVIPIANILEQYK